MKIPILTERLRQRVKALGLSASAVAERGGFGATTMRVLLRSTSSAGTRLVTLQRIATVIDVRPSYLVGEIDVVEPFVPDGGPDFAERLEICRSGLGISFEQLGKRAGLSPPTVAAARTKSPHVSTVLKLAAALETTFAFLAGEAEPSEVTLADRTRRFDRRIPVGLLAAAEIDAIPFFDVLTLDDLGVALRAEAEEPRRPATVGEWRALWRRLAALPVSTRHSAHPGH